MHCVVRVQGNGSAAQEEGIGAIAAEAKPAPTSKAKGKGKAAAEEVPAAKTAAKPVTRAQPKRGRKTLE